MSAGRSWMWPAALVTLLAVSAAVNIAVAVVASRDASVAVETDYYAKAVTWDRAMAQEERNAALGWTVGARLEPAGPDARLRVTVADASGRPLDGLDVAVEAFHSARSAQRLHASLVGEGRGRYAADLAARRAGLWEIRLEAHQGATTYTATLVRELSPAR